MRKDLKKWKSWASGEPRKGQSYEVVPHYCKKANEWRCMVNHEWARRPHEECGSLEYVMSEFTRDGEIYEFRQRDGSKEIEGWHDHEHSFEDVLVVLLNYPETFSVEGYEAQYSLQQLNLLKAVKEKLLALGKGNRY